MSMFVCYNRCLYCGCRTPHEVCHLHSRVMADRTRSWRGNFDRSMARAWERHFHRIEVCSDKACPQLAVDWQ